jgi:HEAT repeat protein
MTNRAKRCRITRMGWRRAGLGLFLGTAILVGIPRLGPASSPASFPSALGQEPAARPSESLDAILKALLRYDYSQGVGEPLKLRAYIAAHKADPAEREEVETKLLAFLEQGPTEGGMMAACRGLRLVGTAASAPVLGQLLLAPETTDPARYALEMIPGPEADAAFLAALDRTGGEVRLGIISSLGHRAVAAAVPRLTALARREDPAAAVEAVKAMGKIGSAEAVRSLSDLLERAKGALKSGAASALLLCAEARLAVDLPDEAAELCDRVLLAGVPDVLRRAAFRERIEAAGSADDGGFVLRALSGNDQALREPAIAMIPKAFQDSEIEAVVPYLAKLTEEQQVQLTAVLAGYPTAYVLPTLLQAADSRFPSVRVEALRALEKAGNATIVEFLAARAAASTGVEQAAARETLARLKGADVDAAILNMLEKETGEKVRLELITAAGERRIVAGKPVLAELVRTGPPAVQLRAIRVLRVLAAPADLRDLISLVFAVKEEAAREEMEDTVAAVARTIPRESVRAEAVENALAAEKSPPRRADLLRVLGKIGDDSSLGVVRRALHDANPAVADAAVRALTDWPTLTARDDVLAIARTTTNPTYKVLAIRAYVRMIGLEPDLRPQGAVAGLQTILGLSDRPEEKKLVLGMLPRFPCEPGLKLAQSLAADPSVEAEAKLAAERIERSLARR